MSNVLSIFDTESAAENGSKLHLLHPATGQKVYADGDKKNKPLTITLKGADCAEYQRTIMKAARAKKQDLSDEEMILQTAELYARLTMSWENIGMDFTFENAVKVYRTHKDIRVQIGDFIADKRNFIKA